jgi:4-amino-4-deoxy-L-arabinose transferase-like glycosyltransferase
MDAMKSFTVLAARDRTWVIRAAAVVVFLSLASGLLMTRRPWCDEAWFGNISHSILTRGNTGVSVVHPAGTANAPGGLMKGIDQGFYLWIPTQEFCNAILYRVAGFGLFQMRATSMLWCAALLAAVYFAVLKLSGSVLAASLALLLLATDYVVLLAASDGRKDAMSAALWFIGMAVYVHLRERRLPLAVLASQSLVAFSMLTHPIGLAGFVVTAALILTLDFKNLRIAHWALGAVPYLAAAGVAASYVLTGWESFQSQFSVVFSSNRASGMRSPLATLWREFTTRIPEFYFPATASGVQRGMRLLIPILLGTGVAGALSTRSIRQDKNKRLVATLPIVGFLTMALYDGAKHFYYLIHLTPLFCAATALWLSVAWEEHRGFRPALAGIVVTLASLQVVWAAAGIARDPYHRSFIPMASFVQRQLDLCGRECFVVGSAELGFQLGFTERLRDDALLGYRSGLRPNFIVMDQRAYLAHLEAFDSNRPEIARHMRAVLANDMRINYDDGYYQVYGRR